MRLLMILDSMELNGGSSMFLEMILGFSQYYPDCKVEPLVVSKSGQYGRRYVTSADLTKSYDSRIPCMSYEVFENIKDDMCSPDGTIVVHHRLGCTRSLKVPCPYVVINHTIEYPHRMKKFRHANCHVSVCKHIQYLTATYVKSKVILNGVEDDYIDSLPSGDLDGTFKTGRCHRLAASKFNRKSLDFLEKVPIRGHVHFLIGPSSDKGRSFKKYKRTKYLGPIFNRQRKMSIIKDLDVYYYDSNLKEGASIAILEALACGVPVLCRPRGGNKELLINGVNGFFFENFQEAKKLLIMLSSPDFLAEMKEKVRKDFSARLHIRHGLKKYMKIFTKLLT